MLVFRKGQMGLWCYGQRITGEVRLMERPFGLKRLVISRF